MQTRNTPLLTLFRQTANGLLTGPYKIMETVHVLFNISQIEAAHAFSEELFAAAQAGLQVRSSFEEELSSIMELLRQTYFGGRSPAWFDRGVELFIHEAIRLVLIACTNNTADTSGEMLRRSCDLILRVAEGLHHSTVARPCNGPLAIMLVMEGVRTSVVYSEEDGVVLDSSWAVFVEALAKRILDENHDYTGGPVSKSSSLGHACCSDPIRVLFQKVALNRDLLGETESIHCASLSRILSSLSRHASEASAHVKTQRAPCQSNKKVNWGIMSRHIMKQGVLKRTLLERTHWDSGLLFREDIDQNTHTKGNVSPSVDTPPRSPAVAARPNSLRQIKLNL